MFAGSRPKAIAVHLPWFLPLVKGPTRALETQMMPAFRALGVRGDYPPPAAAGGRETGLGHLHVSGSASRPPTPRQTAREETLGTQYYGGFQGEALRARAARRRRSSHTGVSLGPPLAPSPTMARCPFLGALHHRAARPPGRW